jgi:hypothetical protein
MASPTRSRAVFFNRSMARPHQDRRGELPDEGIVVDNEDWTEACSITW